MSIVNIDHGGAIRAQGRLAARATAEARFLIIGALRATFAATLKPALRALMLKVRYAVVYARLSNHFDEEFYRYCYADHIGAEEPLKHYLAVGRWIGLDPNPDFSLKGYLEDNPDARNAPDDPYFLYISTQKKLGRLAKPSERRVEYFTAKLFDSVYYLSTYPDVRASTDNPLLHYINVGWKQARNPRADFSSQFYLDRYEDARVENVNPLYHFVLVGKQAGRTTSPLPTALQTNSQDQGLCTAEEQNGFLVRLMQRQPEMTTKWLRPNHLTLAFNAQQRLSALFYNYRFLAKRLQSDVLHDLLYNSYELWRSDMDDGQDYRIVLKIADPAINEGELSVEFHSSIERLYVMSFTIVDGAECGLPAEPALLISRIQGDGSKFDRIKAASKALRDVAPSFMLLAALQGLAQALGISWLAFVSSAFQVSAASAGAREGYDRFFEALGLEQTTAAFVTSPVPLVEKPMSQVKKGHRLRTKAKRALKQDVTATAEAAVRSALQSEAFPLTSQHVSDVAPSLVTAH